MLFKHNLYYGKQFFSPDGNGGGGSGAGSSDGGGSGAGEGDNGAGDSGGDDGDDGEDTGALKLTLEKERKDRKTAQRELRDALKRLSDLENAGKTDEQKRDADLQAALDRATAAEERAKRTSGQAAVFKAAADSLSPEAVYALAKDQLEFDEDAEPTNVDEVIEAVRKSNPKLFPGAKGSADGGKQGATTYEPKPGVDRMRHAYEQNEKAAKR